MTVFPFLMDVFLLPAVILNINKWIYFKLLIMRYVRSGDDVESNTRENAKLEKGKD